MAKPRGPKAGNSLRLLVLAMIIIMGVWILGAFVLFPVDDHLYNNHNHRIQHPSTFAGEPDEPDIKRPPPTIEVTSPVKDRLGDNPVPPPKGQAQREFPHKAVTLALNNNF